MEHKNKLKKALIFNSLVHFYASDIFNINSQLEHLQEKYVGIGHANLSRLNQDILA